MYSNSTGSPYVAIGILTQATMDTRRISHSFPVVVECSSQGFLCRKYYVGFYGTPIWDSNRYLNWLPWD